LQECRIGKYPFQWYGQSVLDDVDAIDMLIVDGPPSATGELARYPALPVLADRLSEGASVLLDDAARDDEQRVIERWRREQPRMSGLHELSARMMSFTMK
jgi:hypothetical protein